VFFLQRLLLRKLHEYVMLRLLYARVAAQYTGWLKKAVDLSIKLKIKEKCEQTRTSMSTDIVRENFTSQLFYI